MTLSELKKKVAESTNKEWFQNRQLDIDYPHIQYRISLTGIVSIFDFVSKQVQGFDKYESLPKELQTIRTRFNNIKNKITDLVTNDTKNDYEWNNHINQLTGNSSIIFPSDAPETEFLLKLSKDFSEYYRGAYEFLSGTTPSPTAKNNLMGYLMAYEFVMKDKSTIVERKESEKKSISRIRTEFQQQLSEAENQLTEYLATAKQEVISYSSQLDNFQTEKQLSYTEWFNQKSTGFEGFQKESKTKIEELENLYKEKLKLEAPAKYWDERAEKLRKEGYRWLIGLIVCIGIGIVVLIWVLNMIADGTFVRVFSNTASAIKWSVALITLISFIAYAIRVISKLTFSSFHLVRDAEEREQLTYVYLALHKEKGIDQTERHLVMQSLFSRADTGLLKDDASPTMPGNIVDKFVTK